MLIGTLKMCNGSKAIQFVFLTLFILFILLAFINATGMTGLLVIAGIDGLLLGFGSLYAALAMVLNEICEKPVAPGI
jgi:hypothetical protein